MLPKGNRNRMMNFNNLFFIAFFLMICIEYWSIEELQQKTKNENIIGKLIKLTIVKQKILANISAVIMPTKKAKHPIQTA